MTGVVVTRRRGGAAFAVVTSFAVVTDFALGDVFERSLSQRSTVTDSGVSIAVGLVAAPMATGTDTKCSYTVS